MPDRTPTYPDVTGEHPDGLPGLGDPNAAFAGLLQFSRDAIVISDCDGRIVEFNKGAEVMFGWDRADVIGKSVGDMIVPHDLRAGHEAGMARLRAGGTHRVIGAPVEMRALRRSGQEFPCELVLSEIDLADTKLFAAILRDITGLRAALDEQRRMTDFLQSIFDDQTEVIFHFDAERRLTFANLAAVRLYGLTLEEMRGQHVFDDVHPDVLARLEAELDALTPEAPTIRSTDPKVLPDGRTRWMDFTNRALFDADGNTRGLLTVGRDVTERVQAEAALKASEERFAAFMHHAPLGMYLKDENGIYLMANPEMNHVFERPTADILGQHARDLFDPEFAAMIEDTDQQVLQSSRAIVTEQHNPDQDRYEWTLSVRFPVPSAEVDRTMVGGFNIDITPIKLAEEDLAEARAALFQNEKMNALGEFAAGVVHELNNPLMILAGQAEMLAEEAVDGPLAERAKKIEEVVARCGRIARSFLSMARRTPPRRDVLDVADIVTATLDVAGPALRRAGINLTYKNTALPFTVLGDADQLQQVLLNLILNAQQALADVPTGKRDINLETGPADDDHSVKIDVSDSGAGVPTEKVYQIFEPFVTTKSPQGGTGLGLSISRQMIEAQGGTLELVPSSSGARFRITIPASQDL